MSAIDAEPAATDGPVTTPARAASRSRRIPKDDRIRPLRETVRDEILQAATEHFLAVGYRAAKLDTIASRAGYTKGAIYSNFGSKQDLFLGLLEARIEQFVAGVAADAPATGFVDLLADRLAHEVHTQTAWHVLVVEFAVAAANDPDTSAQYVALRSRRRDDLVRRLQAVRPNVPARAVQAAATALLAMANGLSLEIAANPAGISEPEAAEALRGVLAAFFRPADGESCSRRRTSPPHDSTQKEERP